MKNAAATRRRKTTPSAVQTLSETNLIQRALIVHPEPLSWILGGKKVWELRSQPTKIRGCVALLEKGSQKILGTVTIADCLGPLSPDAFMANATKMNYAQAELELDRDAIEQDLAYGLYAWVLEDVVRLPRPVRFHNPSGAVTWVRLPPKVAEKLLTKRVEREKRGQETTSH